MKILMIAPEPFLDPRGTPISVYQRLQALSALKHRVDLLTYHVGKDVCLPGVKIHRIINVPFIKQVKPGPSWAKLFLDILIFFKAIVMLITKRYDVIHTHEEAVFFAIILAALFRTRHLYDMHSSLPRQLQNFDFWSYRLFVKLFKTLEKCAINTCDAVITVSSDLEEYVREINPTAKLLKIENLAVQNIVTHLNQAPVEALKERLGVNGKLPVVYTGNFENYQGIDLLIESAEIVKKRHPAVLFLLVGGKSQQIEYWQNEIKRKHLEEWVQLVGPLPLEETLTYIEMAEVLVSPRAEGMSVPLKIYTYLHSGKPIVATNLVAHSQVLNEDVALLVPPTKEALAEAILKLAQSPMLSQRLGRRAQTLAMVRFSPENYLAKVDQIYRTLNPSAYPLEPMAAAPDPAPSLKVES